MKQWSPQEFQDPTWQVNPRIELDGLRPPSVLWTLMPSDPLPGYRERATRNPMPDFSALRTPSSPDQFSSRQAYLAAAWDIAFRDVTGDRVWLLVDDRKVTQLPPVNDGERRVVLAATFTAVSSNEPSGSRWFVTKAVLHKGRALAWAVRVNAETGKMARVGVAEDNALDLEQEYHNIPRTA